ncbi:MAG: radical SAM protein [Candidatus Omnitrophica bacterium]|nr:radical SAM protein [Candidatus Omnitrophota bacterium]
MQEIQYKTFSLKTHKKNWHLKRPNVCQFELTFKCGIHCKHCYTDCYNRPGSACNELGTKEVKFILDKIHNAGVIWLCFTGGDPLARKDFLEIYSYAKNKGFIVTIFTNACSMTKEIAGYLRKSPPFVIEITLNAVTKGLYEKISRVEGSFEKAMAGIKLITQRRLPLKIKTQVIKDNFKELGKIKEFVESLGLGYLPSIFLHSRLDGNLTPSSLRVSSQEVLSLNGKKGAIGDDCRLLSQPLASRPANNLFQCAIGGGDGVHIDPYGNLFPCICIREPKINLLKENIEQARDSILSWVRSKTFTINSKCRVCSIKGGCRVCPGKALLETGSLEKPVEWFCELAKAYR